MKRKSPVKHRVRTHKKKDKVVSSYTRGHGSKKTKVSTPRITLANSRIQAKISELKRFKQMAKEQNNLKMEKFYEAHIRAMLRLLGKTRKQMYSEILLAGDELSTARAGDYNFNYVYRLEKAFELMQKITGLKYPEPKYVLAKGTEQSAYLIGYRPKSEKLVWISPTKFLSLAGYAIAYDKESLEKVRRRMQTSEPLDALYLDVDVNTHQVRQHEGRHRAKVAQELGIKKVPVLLYAKDGYDWESAKKLPSVDQIVRQGR